MQIQLLQVAQFMRQFEQEINLLPVKEISYQLFELRDKLAIEESQEFRDAFADHEDYSKLKVHQAKALAGLCDRLYILFGDALSLGFGMLLPVAFRRVHESNMSKLWTEREMAETVYHGTGLKFKRVSETDERCFIAYNPIGKIVKSPSYEPANLQDLLDEFEGQELLNFDKIEEIVYGDAPPPDFDELLELYGKDFEDEED